MKNRGLAVLTAWRLLVLNLVCKCDVSNGDLADDLEHVRS